MSSKVAFIWLYYCAHYFSLMNTNLSRVSKTVHNHNKLLPIEKCNSVHNQLIFGMKAPLNMKIVEENEFESF